MAKCRHRREKGNLQCPTSTQSGTCSENSIPKGAKSKRLIMSWI